MNFLPTLPLEITPLIAFGLLLIFGAIGGYIAHRLTWLPSITGFMAIGFLIGPSGLGFLSQPTLNSARIVVDIALALILYRLGLSLDLRAIWRDRKLALISVVESGITFGVVLYVLHLFGLPLVVAALVAAIAISSSPAVLLHVAHEVGAEGDVTETAKTLVALNNCISFVAFSAVLPLMHHSIGSDWVQIIVQPSYRLFGSLALGVTFGIVVHQLATRTKDADQYILAIVIGSTMLSIGLASELGLSTIPEHVNENETLFSNI